MKIFVAKLPYDYQETEIAALFAPFGQIDTINLVMDRETGRSKCYAFVEMPNDDEALQAIKALDQKEIGSRPIAVSQAQTRERSNSGFNRSKGGFQRGGGGYGNRNEGYNKDRGSYNRGGDKQSDY